MTVAVISPPLSRALFGVIPTGAAMTGSSLIAVTVMSKAADHQRLLRPGLRTFVTSEQLVPMTSQGALMRACDIIPRVR
ncbi:MAG: hypothetical protein HN380_33935, partial [Victivallales bacterium]|nr:hypothetical protein [Victivallales bacterium]